MFDAFKSRHYMNGGSMNMAVRNQSDTIMNATFTRDPMYREVYINGQAVDAKYIMHSKRSLSGDEVDYYLMFRPGVYYDMGTYVDIPNRDGNYERWMIVMKDDRPQFPMHYVLKCNWTLKWIYNGKIYSCLGVQRSRNSYNQGTWRSMEFAITENQTQMWLPTTEDVKTIGYDMRVMITDNEINPVVWRVSKLENTLPVGISKITFAQDQFDPSRDNVELMIADYYTSSLDLEEKVEPPVKPYGDHSRITFNGTQPVLKVNGSYKILTPHFYDADINELDIEPFWSVQFPSGDDKEKFDIMEDGKTLKIKCLKYFDLIGKVITISLSDKDGKLQSYLDLEVVSL